MIFLGNPRISQENLRNFQDFPRKSQDFLRKSQRFLGSSQKIIGFPRKILETLQSPIISWACPGNFPEVSRGDSDISRRIPGHVRELFWKFPGLFADMSRTFPQTFPGLVPEIYWNFPGDFRHISWNVPRNVQDSSRTFFGNVPDISWKSSEIVQDIS